ncbi:MAG: XamI family restriction endonuclease [Deltaproteobacteria bacterium]|nr:XamI family restriction endonuclease [Deltaproteobacteria bacterium]
MGGRSDGDRRNTVLSSAALSSDEASAARIAEIILRTIDPRRFPWVKEKRAPRPKERAAAILASAALLAAQKLATFRRNLSKLAQEEAVKNWLTEIGLKEVKARTIKIFDDAPKAGEFCRESIIGDTKADVPVRLYDDRLLAIECKSSNSAVNSFKRINHEAAGKAVRWLRQLGEAHIVPAAVLSGVFSPENLSQAQRVGLTMFWSHRLNDLGEFIIGTKR